MKMIYVIWPLNPLNTFVSTMYRQIAAIFLLIAFSAHIFNKAVIVLDYYANTAAFAKDCENKSRPALACKGKCQMMKKLQEEEKKEQQSPERKSDHKNPVVSSRSFFTTLADIPKPLAATHVVCSLHNLQQGIPADIFHPPALA